jgi:hypothetical protein
VPRLDQLKLGRPLLLLFSLSVIMTLLTIPLSRYLDPKQGLALCLLAGATCFVVGVIVLSLPLLFPVAETYLMVVALGVGVRMLLPLIGCAILAVLVGVHEARVFAICLLIISPVLLFTETWLWARRFSANERTK